MRTRKLAGQRVRFGTVAAHARPQHRDNTGLQNSSSGSHDSPCPLYIGVINSKPSPLWAAKNVGDLPQSVNFALKASIIRDFLESRGVEHQSKSLAATNSVTDLPGKLSGAVFPLQCIGTLEATDSKPNAVSRAELPAVGKCPGVDVCKSQISHPLCSRSMVIRFRFRTSSISLKGKAPTHTFI